MFPGMIRNPNSLPAKKSIFPQRCD
jgi:hypothetical protein